MIWYNLQLAISYIIDSGIRVNSCEKKGGGGGGFILFFSRYILSLLSFGWFVITVCCGSVSVGELIK